MLLVLYPSSALALTGVLLSGLLYALSLQGPPPGHSYAAGPDPFQHPFFNGGDMFGGMGMQDGPFGQRAPSGRSNQPQRSRSRGRGLFESMSSMLGGMMAGSMFKDDDFFRTGDDFFRSGFEGLGGAGFVGGTGSMSSSSRTSTRVGPDGVRRTVTRTSKTVTRPDGSKDTQVEEFVDGVKMPPGGAIGDGGRGNAMQTQSLPQQSRREVVEVDDDSDDDDDDDDSDIDVQPDRLVQSYAPAERRSFGSGRKSRSGRNVTRIFGRGNPF